MYLFSFIKSYMIYFYHIILTENSNPVDLGKDNMLFN